MEALSVSKNSLEITSLDMPVLKCTYNLEKPVSVELVQSERRIQHHFSGAKQPTKDNSRVKQNITRVSFRNGKSEGWNSDYMDVT